MHNGPFPFLSVKEAWEYFNKAARLHLAHIIRKLSKEQPDLKHQFKMLKHKSYCARLLYLLAMFELDGECESEFDMDWAMLLAHPMSADQARRSINDLTKLGLLSPIANEENTKHTATGGNRRSVRGKRTPPTKSGGDTSRNTRFNFD